MHYDGPAQIQGRLTLKAQVRYTGHLCRPDGFLGHNVRKRMGRINDFIHIILFDKGNHILGCQPALNDRLAEFGSQVPAVVCDNRAGHIDFQAVKHF